MKLLRGIGVGEMIEGPGAFAVRAIRRHWCHHAAWAGCAWAVISAARADVPTLTLSLATGSGQPLNRALSQWQPLPEAPNEFRFELGFSTSETFGAGSVFDGLTLFLQSSTPGQTATIATLDASGPAWRPTTPGGLTLPAESVTFVELNQWGGPLAPEASRWIYQGTFHLPESLQGQSLQVGASLFDNLDAHPSSGYVRFSVIPEPGPLSLLLLGGWAGISWWRRPSKRRQSTGP